MDSFIFIAVLSAAFLHAFWNFLVKSNHDKSLAVLAVCLGHIPFGLVGFVYSGLPPLSSFGFIIGSALLHTGYQIFLMHAYRFGELSAVYPIARGLSPLLLTLATVIWGHEILTANQVMGILFIGGALVVLGFSQYRLSQHGLTGVIFAIATGCFIATYSMVDALGTREAGSAIAFYGSLSILNGTFLSLYFMVWHRHCFKALVSTGQKVFWVGGGASYLAYVIVLWACLHAPIAVVSSFRETSTLIAVMLGIFILKEKVTTGKLVASSAIIAGVALTKLG